jgi:allantoicase
MAGADKIILFLGQTFAGHTHDYTMFKAEFPPEQAWFAEVAALLDLGYQGIRTDYPGKVDIPIKKPRKSKANPEPHLSDAQKQHNRTLAKLRIFVEHAIAGLKRYGILVAPYRNRKANFEDDVVVVSAGLWNFLLL